MARKPDPVADARRALDESRFAIASHRKHCYDCRSAETSGRLDRSCEWGWKLLKLERAAAKQLRQADTARDALNGRQLALW